MTEPIDIEALRAGIAKHAAQMHEPGARLIINPDLLTKILDELEALRAKVAEQAAEIERLRALKVALDKVSPIRVHDGRDYAEVYFADGATHSTQAMTMNPQDWRDIAAALSPPPGQTAQRGTVKG